MGGLLLGLVLFAAFFITGNGLGASGGLNRILVFFEDLIAPGHVDRTSYLITMAGGDKNPLDSWIVMLTVGTIFGGFVSGWLNGRVKLETNKGPNISKRTRWAMAFIGGGFMGYGARMARGCTSGQALSGGAVLSVGSWAFMFAVFGGAYALAYFVRKLWNLGEYIMATFPLALTALLGKPLAYLIFLAIGFGFGYVLESSGFAHSPKLAAQFYFKDMTVLKVMFTGIIVAMVLIFASTALGWLDFRLLWVPPTYLWPGIVGGLIMGVGFIIGGFCPGTSLTALATLKLDGVFFVFGAIFGIFMFGETVEYFQVWWNSSYMGRFTLPELFNVETGWVVLGVVLMALFMFWGSEQLEKIFGGKDPKQAPKWRYYGAGALVVIALAVLVIGQPTTADRWAKIAPEKSFELDARTSIKFILQNCCIPCMITN